MLAVCVQDPLNSVPQNDPTQIAAWKANEGKFDKLYMRNYIASTLRPAANYEVPSRGQRLFHPLQEEVRDYTNSIHQTKPSVTL